MTQRLASALFITCLIGCSREPPATHQPQRTTVEVITPSTSAGSIAPTPEAAPPNAPRPEPEPEPNTCASASVTTHRVIPDVYFLIDGSGSMAFAFGDQSRWDALGDALLGPSGVIPQLTSTVRFGMSIYAWQTSAPSCPTLIDVPPALEHLPQLSAAYPLEQPGGGTPTGEALQHLVDRLPTDTNTPPIIVLATDGEPTGCKPAITCDLTDLAKCLDPAQLETAFNYDTTLAGVRAARAKNIAVWVISLAEGLDQSPDLHTTANIGAGLADDASPGAPIYSPTNVADLSATLTQLVTAAASCEIALAGELDVTRACEGSVLLDGQPLRCDQPDGWRVIDRTHIVLQGAACDRLKSNPQSTLDARFACDVLIPE